jgi:sugar transferase (PEP-CTERM/EpsH1 system associated)
MKILMLSPVIPWPPVTGSKTRIFHILKELSGRHDITFIARSDGSEKEADLRHVKEFCARLVVFPGARSRGAAVFYSLFSRQPYRVVKFQSPGFQRKVNQILDEEDFDLVWANRLNMMSFLEFSRIAGKPVVVDQQDADEQVWIGLAGKGNWAARRFAARNLRRLRRFEKSAMPRVDQLISVSAEDAAFMSSRFPGLRPLWVVPNGIDTEHFRPSSAGKREDKPVILFCGSLDITMNIDAVLWFAAEVFPSIRRESPAVEFLVVGRRPAARIKGLAKREGITVSGNVPDVRPYYNEARVAVAPFRLGGGTKLKVIEAMAMGVPVVSTAAGCRGLDVTDGVNIVIADEPAEMSRRIVALTGDRKEREKIAAEARKLVEERYDWKRTLRGLGEKLERLAADKIGEEQPGLMGGRYET